MSQKMYAVILCALCIVAVAVVVSAEYNCNKADFVPGLFIRTVVEGSGYNKGIQLYNPTSEDIDLRQFSIWIDNSNSAERQLKFSTLGYNMRLKGTIKAGGVFTIASPQAANEMLLAADMLSHGVAQQNGDDVIALVCGTIDYVEDELVDPVVIDQIGFLGPKPTETDLYGQEKGWDVCGKAGFSTMAGTIQRKAFITYPNHGKFQGILQSQSANPDGVPDGIYCDWNVFGKDYVGEWNSPPAAGNLDDFQLAVDNCKPFLPCAITEEAGDFFLDSSKMCGCMQQSRECMENYANRFTMQHLCEEFDCDSEMCRPYGGPPKEHLIGVELDETAVFVSGGVYSITAKEKIVKAFIFPTHLLKKALEDDVVPAEAVELKEMPGYKDDANTWHVQVTVPKGFYTIIAMDVSEASYWTSDDPLHYFGISQSKAVTNALCMDTKVPGSTIYVGGGNFENFQDLGVCKPASQCASKGYTQAPATASSTMCGSVFRINGGENFVCCTAQEREISKTDAYYKRAPRTFVNQPWVGGALVLTAKDGDVPDNLYDNEKRVIIKRVKLQTLVAEKKQNALVLTNGVGYEGATPNQYGFPTNLDEGYRQYSYVIEVPMEKPAVYEIEYDVEWAMGRVTDDTYQVAPWDVAYAPVSLSFQASYAPCALKSEDKLLGGTCMKSCAAGNTNGGSDACLGLKDMVCCVGSDVAVEGDWRGTEEEEEDLEEDNMITYVLAGAGACVALVIVAVVAIVCVCMSSKNTPQEKPRRNTQSRSRRATRQESRRMLGRVASKPNNMRLSGGARHSGPNYSGPGRLSGPGQNASFV